MQRRGRIGQDNLTEADRGHGYTKLDTMRARFFDRSTSFTHVPEDQFRQENKAA